ncbi:hypothetical protein ACVBEH_06380 [Roseateles sp. GG27B]
MAKAPWFDSKKMPQASFQSSADSGNVGGYYISGNLNRRTASHGSAHARSRWSIAASFVLKFEGRDRR